MLTCTALNKGLIYTKYLKYTNNIYKLFKYLFDNYYKDSRRPTKRQLTNIWFYLNEYDKIKYNLKATKDSYTLFIKKYYSIEINEFCSTQNYIEGNNAAPLPILISGT